MKTLKLTTRSHYSPRTFLMYVATPVMLALCMSAAGTLKAHAYVQITGQLDTGARSANVTSLQQFLASMPTIYPEGLVTGYFGSLTRAAVQRFQSTYGIVSSGSPSTTGYGRVGPSTLAKLNELIAGGTGPVSTGDTSGPWLYSVNQSISSNQATFTWNTNENATARVFYDTAPVQFNEGQADSSGFGARTGQIASLDSNLRTSHNIALTGLAPNTTYYYTLVSTDASGNVSVYGPNNTFRTAQ